MDSLPSFAPNYERNGALPNSVLRRQLTNSCSAHGVLVADICHSREVQACRRVALASYSIRPSAQPVAFPVCSPPFVLGVLNISKARSQKEMGSPHTRRIVASVKNVHPSRDWAVLQLVANAVRAFRHPVHLDAAISRTGTSPYPAVTRLVYHRPKATRPRLSLTHIGQYSTLDWTET